jgi:hypothetical protein
MKETINLWISKKARIPGVLACGVLYADKSIFAQSWSPHYPLPALESLWQTAGEGFQVLQLNRLPSARLRWIYENALLHAAHRSDGICLGLLTVREPQSSNSTDLESILAEFERLKALSNE